MTSTKIQRQSANRDKGEYRTSTYLADEFWVLKRPVDIDGADFLIQLPATTLEDLRGRSRYIEVLGIVQSKFFEKKNGVSIHKKYVLDAEGKPRSEFFCFFHTDDLAGEHISYFFVAEDIVRELAVTSCGEYYRFKLTKKCFYEKQKNMGRKHISQVMKAGIQRTEIASNTRFVRELFKVYSTPTLHHEEQPDFVYSLRIVEGVRIVLCRSSTGPHGHLLEMRRDLFPNQGAFFWGGSGTGPKFLAVSMLAHHMNGEIPTAKNINDLVVNLLSKIDMDSECNITSREILSALQRKSSRESEMDTLERNWFGDMHGKGVELVEVLERIDNELRVKCKRGEEFRLIISVAGMSKVPLIDHVMKQIARSTDAAVPVFYNFALVLREPTTSKALEVSLSEVYRFHND
ncbi:hypothetical protein ACIQVE_03120 [Pseudomonas sp. NPDC098747]|uniref:hypothetical protein n=1 Tax=Pseudomonas sp. NPDC098747 TaxID=3364487 RepID=UPI00383A594F